MSDDKRTVSTTTAVKPKPAPATTKSTPEVKKSTPVGDEKPKPKHHHRHHHHSHKSTKLSEHTKRSSRSRSRSNSSSRSRSATPPPNRMLEGSRSPSPAPPPARPLERDSSSSPSPTRSKSRSRSRSRSRSGSSSTSKSKSSSRSRSASRSASRSRSRSRSRSTSRSRSRSRSKSHSRSSSGSPPVVKTTVPKENALRPVMLPVKPQQPEKPDRPKSFISVDASSKTRATPKINIGASHSPSVETPTKSDTTKPEVAIKPESAKNEPTHVKSEPTASSKPKEDEQSEDTATKTTPAKPQSDTLEELQHANIMYSNRESNLLQDIFHFLITKYPNIILEFFNRCDNREMWDDLAESLITMFIRYFVNAEMQKHSANDTQASFRENSVASKVTKAYLRKVGGKYLYDLLNQFMHQICIVENKKSLEIDPAKLESTEEATKRTQLLQNKVDLLINKLISQAIVDKMPPGIRIVASYFAELAQKQEMDPLPIIGSFIVLRYLNPAIFSPEHYGLLPPGKMPSPIARRNLVLISKILQNIANGVTFNMKESYMSNMNGYIEKSIPRLQEYFKSLVSSVTSTTNLVIDSDICVVSVKDLHLLHKLLSQHKEVIFTLIENENDKKELEKKLDALGSYANKISFACALGATEQKHVKELLIQRREEASFIGWITVVQKRLATEKVILVVGLNRIFTIKAGGKLLREGCWLDLKEITSNTPKEIRIIFKNFEIFGESEQADEIIYCIRRAYENILPGLAESSRYKLSVNPATRIEPVTPGIAFHDLRMTFLADKPCGGFVDTYVSLCDYHNVIPSPALSWDIENLYSNNTRFNLHNFFSEESGEDTNNMATSELVPVFQALWNNRYFTGLTVKDRKLDKAAQTLIEIFRFNCTLTSLILVNVNLTEKSFCNLFEAMSSNSQCLIDTLDVSENQCFDDKVINSLAQYVTNTKAPSGVVSLKMANTCTNPKSIIALGNLLCGLNKMRAGPCTLSHLDISRNKLADNVGQFNMWFSSGLENLTYLNVSYTAVSQQKLASFFAAISQGCKHLSTLEASGLKISKPEEGVHFSQILCLPSLTELNLSESINNPAAIQDILQSTSKEGHVQLSFAGNNIFPTGSTIIHNIAPKITGIISLDLSNTDLGDDGIVTIVEGVMLNTSLTSLNLNGCFGKGTRPRTDVPRVLQKLIASDCPLETLKIAGGRKENQQLSKLLLPFLHAMTTNETLTELDVSAHALGNSGVNSHLSTLYYDDNMTGMVGLTAIVGALKANQTIRSMPVPVNDIAALMSNSPEDVKKRLRVVAQELQQSVGAHAGI